MQIILLPTFQARKGIRKIAGECLLKRLWAPLSLLFIHLLFNKYLLVPVTFFFKDHTRSIKILRNRRDE